MRSLEAVAQGRMTPFEGVWRRPKIQSLLRAIRAVSSEEERVSYKHQVGISIFSPPTNHGPLAQWESRRPISDRQRIETAMDCQQRIKPMGDDHKRGSLDPERKAAW